MQIKKNEVLTGFSIFFADSRSLDSHLPKEWAERRVNLQSFDKVSKEGRFAALEVSELLVKEITSFFYK